MLNTTEMGTLTDFTITKISDDLIELKLIGSEQVSECYGKLSPERQQELSTLLEAEILGKVCVVLQQYAKVMILADDYKITIGGSNECD